MIRNFIIPAIIERSNRIMCLVQTCSECSMDTINGKINVNGFIHRSLYRDKFGNLNCRKCPVHLNSTKTGELYEILSLLDGEK